MPKTTILDDRKNYHQNYIINGNFDYWQRGTSFAGNGYTADRFGTGSSNTSTRTVSRSVLVPNANSIYSLQYLVGTADAAVAAADYQDITYQVEGNDFRNLAAQPAQLLGREIVVQVLRTLAHHQLLRIDEKAALFEWYVIGNFQPELDRDPWRFLPH